jgi:hypothetical protein
MKGRAASPQEDCKRKNYNILITYFGHEMEWEFIN